MGFGRVRHYWVTEQQQCIYYIWIYIYVHILYMYLYNIYIYIYLTEKASSRIIGRIHPICGGRKREESYRTGRGH